ncbi:MAG: hypothetical protein KBC64_01690 [Simkaniaceae bacterium]|nr:hypothetical protein [Simkaniaceae bacterium]
MKINHKILSIPPYISTSWKNIQTLFLKGPSLIITLSNGTEIEIPGLPVPILNEIFQAHTHFIEKDKEVELVSQPIPLSSFSFGFPLTSPDQLGKVMHHNSEQANAADLPQEVLLKIAEITRSMGLDETIEESLPPAEPHCNCPYCQIARTLHQKELSLQEPPEEKGEIVSDEELHFREWNITQIDPHRFVLKNPLNPAEQYQVYLGSPIGCTCGKQNCEHIHFVLRN